MENWNLHSFPHDWIDIINETLQFISIEKFYNELNKILELNFTTYKITEVIIEVNLHETGQEFLRKPGNYLLVEIFEDKD